MGWVSLRLLLSLFAGVIGVALFIFTEELTQRFYTENSNISNKLSKIELNLNRVENDLLKNTILLYYNYDHINKEMDTVESLIDELCANTIFKNRTYYNALVKLKKLKNDFIKYRNNVERFISINGSIKNSIIYIQTLHLKAFDAIDMKHGINYDLMILLAKISTTITMAKNAQDPAFIKNIKNYRAELMKYIPEFEGSAKSLLLSMNRHLGLFSSYFPLYLSTFDKIMNMDLKEKSTEILKEYQSCANSDLSKINYIVRFMLGLYLFSLVIVIYFIFRAEKDYNKLNKLHKDLKKSYITDALTGMKNRQAFIEEKKRLEKPVLILVNIDRFQHLNDFYGIEVGDEVLKRVGEILTQYEIEGISKETYRLGGDDFGILYDSNGFDNDLFKVCENIYRHIDNSEIIVYDIDFDISVTIGASSRSEKLFETADIALKYAKRSQRSHIAVFNKEIDNSEDIAKNITMIKNIKKSISKDLEKTIVAYFQPIVNLASDKVDHYEALARVTGEDERILQPSEFLEVVKMAKMSGVLTTEILRQTLKKAKECNAEFGVNLSAGDIYDIEESEMILRMLENAGDTAKQIVFEILESEDITNYDRVVEFISSVKKLGAKTAIDDFGSGYSNFEKILKLDIDFLKIDGSLIKRLDHDIHAELTVSTIVTFCKKAGMMTIAEYVYNKEIFEKVKKLGIDYAQGYYIGKPSPNILCSV